MNALVQHPHLKSIAYSYNSLRTRTLYLSRARSVYVSQKEYATVHPSLVDVVGTDGQGTCVGLVIRNPRSGMISIAHIDIPDVIEIGLTQMLSGVVDQDGSNDILDVHIINGYNTAPRERRKQECTGFSFEICKKIIEVLCKSSQRFNIKTLHILNRNTIYDQEGNADVKFRGFLVNTLNGSIFPGTFDETTRGPDAFIRRLVRLMAAGFSPYWKDNRLLDTYDTHSDTFCISPLSWDTDIVKACEEAKKLSDREISETFFPASPREEDHIIGEHMRRRLFDYFIKHPHWKETFPAGQPRIFVRTADGRWRRCVEQSQIFKRKC